MKKILVFLLIIVLAPLIGGIYGILHDQFTYTISPEYYTKFKFYQFGLAYTGNEAIFPNPRVQVCIVGFRATWWMGLPIGIILGITGLFHKGHKQMLKVTLQSIMITIVVACITGLIGLLYGNYHLAETGVNWWLPDNLIDKRNFIAVGSMHNFSYEGGVIGLLAGITYSIWKKRKLEFNP
jgi:hypothetical protein